VRLVDLIEGEVEPLGDGFGVEPSLLGKGADASDRQPTALDAGLVFDSVTILPRVRSSPFRRTYWYFNVRTRHLVRSHLLIRPEQCDEACLSGTDLLLEWFCLGLR
jgi:hypothetical protein